MEDAPHQGLRFFHRVPSIQGFGEDGTPQPILTTTLLLAEDTYASEELVDQQPVLLKVMDTADQVRHWGTGGAKRPA